MTVEQVEERSAVAPEDAYEEDAVADLLLDPMARQGAPRIDAVPPTASLGGRDMRSCGPPDLPWINLD